eukprot:COSAG01_NODE_6270_length_3761_cov_20.095576_2_plen_61_part_00
MLVEAITAMGMDISSYGWYLDLRKYGTVPHAGTYRKSDTAQSVWSLTVATLSTPRVWTWI